MLIYINIITHFNIHSQIFFSSITGALKIKEMCYLHAEGFSGGALKHGPFALIEGLYSTVQMIIARIQFNFSICLHVLHS